MIATFRYVMCDVCQDPGPLADSAKEARDCARVAGWRLVRGLDVCPKHPASAVSR